MPLLLTEADVRATLSLDELRKTMVQALAQFSLGKVEQPLRTVLSIGPQAFCAVMPALLENPRALGTKLVTLVGRNAEHGLPTHLATIVLMDPETGELRAIMDGRYITEARTAAVSAVATECLARDSDPCTIGIIGSGVQARSHLEALARVRRIVGGWVWSPNTDHRTRFAEEMSNIAPVRVADSAAEAVRSADIIVLVTGATEPVIQNEWVREGAHIVAVGACRPDQREMDPALVARGRLFVDSREAALAEAGDIVLALADGEFGPDHVAAELGEIITGRAAGRTADNQITIFKSLGMAVEDVAAGHLAYECARKTGRGTPIEL